MSYEMFNLSWPFRDGEITVAEPLWQPPARQGMAFDIPNNEPDPDEWSPPPPQPSSGDCKS